MDKRELTYKELAKFLSLSLTVVSMKLRGECNFTAKDKAKLFEIFGKPVDYLLFKDEP
ncbi:MAG: hypothetical protein IJ685_12240 [Selenomonadaceae bacterium]|nr:hypothetical protein [Selenomonadaceae bacterium]